MNININFKLAKAKFKGYRTNQTYIPGIAILTCIITMSLLLSAISGSAFTSWVITGDTGPIIEAGGLGQPVVGFLQFGITRVYVPLLSVLLVLSGEFLAMSLSRFNKTIAILTGVGSGIQPIVITGCGCGFGTAGTTMSLIEQAIATGLL